MLIDLFIGDTDTQPADVGVLGLLSCEDKAYQLFTPTPKTTSTNHTFSGGVLVKAGSEYSLSKADFITLYTFSLRPSFETTSLNESGPGVEASAAQIASPSISWSEVYKRVHSKVICGVLKFYASTSGSTSDKTPCGYRLHTTHTSLST